MGAADPGLLNRYGEHPADTSQYGVPVDGWVHWNRQGDQDVARIAIVGDHRRCPTRLMSVANGLEVAFDQRHRGNATEIRVSFPRVHRDLHSVLLMRSMLGENISQRILEDLFDPAKDERARPTPVTAHYLERRAIRDNWRQQWRRLRRAELAGHLRQIWPQTTP